MVYDRDYEEKNLKEVLEKYKEVIEDLSLQLKSLNNKQTVDYDVLYDMIRKNHRRSEKNAKKTRIK